MKIWVLLIAILVVLIIGFYFIKPAKAPVSGPAKEILTKMQKVSFKTQDGLNIAADYYPVQGAKFVGILLHMMPAAKESYQGLAQKLNQAGFVALAIDLRGHGESSKGPNGFESFSDQEHQKSILDVQAASDYLKSQGFDLSGQFLIGASIGANLALEFLSQQPQIKTAILLSTGFNYRGIQTQPLMPKLKSGQSVLFAASQNDQRSAGNAVEMAQALASLASQGVETKVITYQNAGHGTDMLSLALGGSNKEQPDLGEGIISWLSSVYK